MNAVVATPSPDLCVELKPTRARPFLLSIERTPRYVGAIAMHGGTFAVIASAWCFDMHKVYLQIAPDQSALYIGDGKFSLTRAEAERLRDELQLPVRSAT